MNLYSTLNGSVVTKKWTSENFTFKKGVFQGDPLSPIIFLAVFNRIIEKLQQEAHSGFKINNRDYITTPFADDFNLITTNKRTNQKLISKLYNWTQSMGLTLKPSKCKSFSIVSGKPQAIAFDLGPDTLGTLEDENHKFLGSTVTFSNKQSEIFKVINKHFEDRLKNIDSLLVRGEYKLKIYIDYLLPASRFILTVHTISATNIQRLDALSRRFLKKWLKLPPSATVAALHCPEFGNIKSISHLYKECQTSAYISCRLKSDELVNTALDSRLDREKIWTRKKVNNRRLRFNISESKINQHQRGKI